jgi:superkiller protein 3
MSGENKVIKASLKEAKDFITKKDFKSALRCCKKTLNVDKNNYMALVFCGLCLAELQQPDQALQVLCEKAKLVSS